MYYIPLFVALFFIVFLVLHFSTSGFANYVAPYGSNSQKQWWTRQGWERFGYPYYSYWENFENPSDAAKSSKLQEDAMKEKQQLANEEKLISFPPDSPAPADLSTTTPYHLLEDTMKPPRTTESISCVNSRSCYATDFNAAIEKTGNFRQLTNNYKRGYPDSCSSPFQELVLNFYKVKDIF